MIAIIVMIMLFLGFFVVVAYNMMSINHNLSVSHQMESIENELSLIKLKLIQSAKPILGENVYSLPYGTDVVESNQHRLPSEIGVPLKNIKGYYYQYCPYGVVDGTSKTILVTQNDTTSYNVANFNLEGLDYTTHSDSPVTFAGAPDIQAFIISKHDSVDVSCSDILYDVNSAAYYLTSAKVAYITKDDIANYYSSQDLAGVTDSYEVSNSTFNNIFNIMSNDTSNKSYNVKLTENITLTKDYSFIKSESKKNNISFDLNGFSIQGFKIINLDGVNLEVHGDGSSATTNDLASFDIDNGNVSLDNALIGGIKATNTKLNIKNSKIQSDHDYGLELKSSELFVDGNNTIDADLKSSTNSLLYMNSSSLYVPLSSNLTINKSGNIQPLYLIGLYNSDLNIMGTLDVASTSGKVQRSEVYIDTGSELYMNGGNLSLLGNIPYHSETPIIMLNGKLTSDGNPSKIDTKTFANVYHFLGSKGGVLNLRNIEFAQNGVVGSGYTIKGLSNVNETQSKGFVSVSGDNTAIINSSGTGCWSDEVFKNIDGSPSASTLSATDKYNNLSNYTCQ